MPRFRCPECNVESEVSARKGHEVMALYCLRHTGGADSHTRPVYMLGLEPSAAASVPQSRAGRAGAAGQVQERAARTRIKRRAADEAEPAASA